MSIRKLFVAAVILLTSSLPILADAGLNDTGVAPISCNGVTASLNDICAVPIVSTGDVVTASYSGWISDETPSTQTIPMGLGPISTTFTDIFGQIWTVKSTFSENALNISFSESTKGLDGNISSSLGLFTIDYSFLSSPISSVTLANYSNSTSHSSSSSNLGLITLTGPQSFQLQFSSMYAGDSYNLNIAAVPEPEVYAMMLMGLGLMGFVARHRKNNQA